MDSKVGLTFGILSDIPISKSVSFQPAINYVQKGFSFQEIEGRITAKLNYLELPLNFVHNTFGKNGHFFIGAGPSIAFEIGGNRDDPARPVEIGANILMGYQLAKGFNIAANYNHGLNNISGGSTKDHNYYFGLRIGYILTCKSKN